MSETTQGFLVEAVEDGLYEGRSIRKGERFYVGAPKPNAYRQPPRAPAGGTIVRASAGPAAGPSHFAGTYRHDDGVALRRNHGDVFRVREGDPIAEWMEPGRLGPDTPLKPDENPEQHFRDRFISDPSVAPGWVGTKVRTGGIPHQRQAPGQPRTFSEINKAKDADDADFGAGKDALAAKSTAHVKRLKPSATSPATEGVTP